MQGGNPPALLTLKFKENEMRNRFNGIDSELTSFFDTLFSPPKTKASDRILKSTRLEDTIFKELMAESDEAKQLQTNGKNIIPTFDILMQDIFTAFYSMNMRRNPEENLSRNAKQLHKPILDDLFKDSEFLTIKQFCEGRELPSFEASIEFSDELSKKLPELLSKLGGSNDSLNVIDKLEDQTDKLKNDLKALQEMQNIVPDKQIENKMISTANILDKKLSQLQHLNQMVSDNIEQASAAFKAVVNDATNIAKEKAQEVNDTISAWGDGSGDAGNTPINRELIQKVRASKKLQNISRTLGRYRDIIANKRKNGYTYGLGEKYDITQGNNINLCLSSELALLASPKTQPLFLRKFGQKALKQYRKREQSIKGSGDIIVCVDESSSMSKIIDWAKAFALSLLDIAAKDKRKFTLIHFASDSELKVSKFEPGKYSIEDILQAAEHFFNGGTDFEKPLSQALKLLKNGYENADIVFVTDGECAVTQEFTANFYEIKKAKHFQVTGILLDKEESNTGISLTPFCDKIYRSSEFSNDAIALQILSEKL